MRLRFYLPVALALLACATAPAANASSLSHRQAVAEVRATGGAVRACRRRAPRHFRCWASYWFELREENEDGSDPRVEYFSLTWRVEVGLKGARVIET